MCKLAQVPCGSVPSSGGNIMILRYPFYIVVRCVSSIILFLSYISFLLLSSRLSDLIIVLVVTFVIWFMLLWSFK